MNNPKLSLLLCIILISSSCKKEDMTHRIKITDEMPGDQIAEMQIDTNNEFYFITSEIDYSIQLPLCSSALPVRYYLSKRASENSQYEILDDNYTFASDILFDASNRLWARRGNGIYLKQGSSFKTVLPLSYEEGSLEIFVLDKEDNIWTGGYASGLYRIDKDLNITHYTPENSVLPKANITAIHVDGENNIWLAMDSQGVVKITDSEWILYNQSNCNITSQRIWCLTSDKDANIWIGTGYENNAISLMKFDGISWEAITPLDDKDNAIRGTVRHLFYDGNKLYVVSEQNREAGLASKQLLTFDGAIWNKMNELSEDDGINDFLLDKYREVVWVITWNNGIFKLKL